MAILVGLHDCMKLSSGSQAILDVMGMVELGRRWWQLLDIHCSGHHTPLLVLAPRVVDPFFLGRARSEKPPGGSMASVVLLAMAEQSLTPAMAGFFPMLEHTGHLGHRQGLRVAEVVSVSCGGCELEDRISRRMCGVSLLEEVVVHESRGSVHKSVEVEERVLLVEQVLVLLPVLEENEELRISTATMAEIVSGVAEGNRGVGRLMVYEILCCGKLAERSSLILRGLRGHRPELVQNSDVMHTEVVVEVR